MRHLLAFCLVAGLSASCLPAAGAADQPAETPAAPAPTRPDMAKLKNPVWATADNLRDPSVLKLGDGYLNITVYKAGAEWLMVYSEGLAAQHLALASSKDLRTWKLEGPVEIDKQGWLAAKYGAPFVWKDDDGWMMILMGESSRGRTDDLRPSYVSRRAPVDAAARVAGR